MRRTILFFLALVSLTVAGQGVKPLPKLHVEGRWLVDNHGNHVVLHGVMDTPSMFFNNERWGSMWQGVQYDANGANRCLAYFEKLFAGMEKAKCTVFRLHMDPAWTNDPNKQFTNGGQEDDISCFSVTRFKTFLPSLYWKLIQKAMNHGMYVVVRPPGVCPKNLKVGDEYNQYLMTVWDIFSQNTYVKLFAGQVSIELANEPVTVLNAQGQEDPRALHDYFQPIVDKIRANGFTGIIWAPGTGYQANYTSYASYPIEGYNIGYAVHDYTGWYGSSDANPSPEVKINTFHQQVPVVDTNPIIITEVDWSPINPNGKGHYNEHGDWVEPNYGTWSTGSTSKWGKAYKACLDHFGNISMTLSGTGCLLDIDQLLKDGSVVPAFGGLEEACGKACMDWYADYYQVDWPHADDEPQSDESLTAVSLAPPAEDVEIIIGSNTAINLNATFQDGHVREVTSLASYEVDAPDVVNISYGLVKALKQGVARVTATYTDAKGNQLTTSYRVHATYFPFASKYISTSIYSEGKYNEATHAFSPGQYGQMGWQFGGGIDLSGFKYLVVKLKSAPSNAHLNLFPAMNIWGDCCSTPDFGSKKQIVVNLKTAKYTSGGKTGQLLDTKNIFIVSFWSNFGTIIVDDMYLTNNDDYSREGATAIVGLLASPTAASGSHVYDMSGRRVSSTGSLMPGVYIMDGNKIVVR